MSKQEPFLKQVWLSYTLKGETCHTEHDQTHSATWKDKRFSVFYSGSHFKLENSDKGDFQTCLAFSLKEKLNNNHSLFYAKITPGTTAGDRLWPQETCSLPSEMLGVTSPSQQRTATKTHSHPKKAVKMLIASTCLQTWLGHRLLSSWMPTLSFLGWSTTAPRSQTVTQPAAPLTKPCLSRHHRVNILSNHSNQHFFLHQSLSWHIAAFPASGFAAHLGTPPLPPSPRVWPNTSGRRWSSCCFT